MLTLNCSVCKKEGRRRNLRKVKNKLFCKSCYHKHLREHRKETIEVMGIKEELKDLKNKYAKELRLKHRNPNTRNYIRKSEKMQQNPSKAFYEPFIQSPKTKKKPKSNSFITLEERRVLLRIIMKNGACFEEARERVSEIVKEQARVREIMKEQGKSEEQIKVKQKEMLEELWKM